MDLRRCEIVGRVPSIRGHKKKKKEEKNDDKKIYISTGLRSRVRKI